MKNSLSLVPRVMIYDRVVTPPALPSRRSASSNEYEREIWDGTNFHPCRDPNAIAVEAVLLLCRL